MKQRTRVIANRQVADTSYELILERKGMTFKAGELIRLYGQNPWDERDYSIASGEEDTHIEVLYRLVPHGTLTPQLVKLRPGDELVMEGPYGDFVLKDPSHPIVFMGTGTGIAPCRSFIRTYPHLEQLTILHGVKRVSQLYYREEFEAFPYYPCVSAEPFSEGTQGRITDLLDQLSFPEKAHFYLCGANEMIYEVSEKLTKMGIPKQHIYYEPYYYKELD